MKRFWLLLLSAVGWVNHAAEPLPYAPAPNDSYWPEQWYLENLNEAGQRIGYDINARGAWPFTRGAGVTIAIVDDGVELAHPDLTNQAAASLQWNFETETPNGNHPSDAKVHGTPVAGLAVAEGNNHRGVIGVAPEAKFASWVIYNTNPPSGLFVNSNKLARMFEFHKDEVAVQNHSWVKPGPFLASMSSVEDLAISNAVNNGRSGKGVVIVRAAGNDRTRGRNVSEDAYVADPRAIAVAALRSDGTVASYSEPGSAVLVSAPGGEIGIRTLFTTDRLGQKGYNFVSFTNDLSDYVFSGLGFQGTSAAAPLISGTVALILSANPELAYRDVQQVLLLSAYQADPTDPDLHTNGAGLFVGHNTGFGLVNAGTAVDIGRHWSNRPPAVAVTNTIVRQSAIPDAGLRVLVTGTVPVPRELQSIITLPSLGVQADDPTAVVPLVFVGDAALPLETNLTGKAALIRRGGATFPDKLLNAAEAGAEFAIIYNNQGTNDLEIMGETDFIPIPAVFMSQMHGEALASFVTNSGGNAQISLEATDYDFNVTDSLLCEQVQVQLSYAHQQRGDLRVTLLSPMGTRSTLQPLGPDTTGFTNTWTFMTTHHFYESSQGSWRLSISDVASGGTGTVQSASLVLHGVRIKDSDKDGLDDDWELKYFNSLKYGPKDDPDNDGYSNAREQIMALNPAVNESPLALDLSQWSQSIVRINWPSRNEVTYEILAAPDLASAFTPVATVIGGFPRSGWYGKVDSKYRFFRVREK